MERNCAKLDALKKVIYFNYEGEDFEIDLTEGDLEDSWNSIQMKDGSIRDINFSWQRGTEPCFSVYLIEDGETIFERGDISLNIVEVVGTREDYFRKMVAKLVTFDIMVRVLVDENATEEQIIELAEDKVQQMKREWAYNVVEIEDDEECPFGTFETDF